MVSSSSEGLLISQPPVIVLNDSRLANCSSSIGSNNEASYESQIAYQHSNHGEFDEGRCWRKTPLSDNQCSINKGSFRTHSNNSNYNDGDEADSGCYLNDDNNNELTDNGPTNNVTASSLSAVNCRVVAADDDRTTNKAINFNQCDENNRTSLSSESEDGGDDKSQQKTGENDECDIMVSDKDQKPKTAKTAKQVYDAELLMDSLINKKDSMRIKFDENGDALIQKKNIFHRKFYTSVEDELDKKAYQKNQCVNFDRVFKKIREQIRKFAIGLVWLAECVCVL